MKRSFISFILFCFAVSLSAQGWVWAKNAVSGQLSAGSAVATDAAGNAYAVGDFFGPATFGSVTLGNAGARDFYLAKYDASGNVIWARSAGGTADDYANAVATDASGNVYVAGYFLSPTMTIGTTTLTNTNGNCCDLFVVKYDASGNVLWLRGAGGTSCDMATAIETDASGNVFVTGWFRNASISFGATTLNNVGLDDIFLVKYDASGNVLWAKGIGSTDLDEGEGITIDASGNIFLTGQFSDTVTFGAISLFSKAYLDVFIVKYNSSGNVIWGKSFGGADTDIGKDITTDAAGNIYCTGSFASDTMQIGTTNLTNSGTGFDMYICKYNSAGNPVWAKSGGGASIEYGNAVASDISGNIYVAGEFDSPVFTFASESVQHPATGFEPMFLVQLDENGNLHCISVLASGGNVCSMDADATGSLYVCSDYYTNPYAFVIGADTFPDTGYQHMFIAKRANVISGIISTPTSCTINNGTASASIIEGNELAYTYQWSPTGGNDSIATGLGAGTYTLTVTDAEGCISTQQVQINNLSTPVVSVSANATINPGDSIMLLASGGLNYNWVPTTGLSCSNCPDPMASPFQTTNYCVIATDTNGCSATACVEITVNDCPIYIPNAFSPNDDGQNDFECVRSNCVAALHFAIYDRWGQKVFESNDQNFCWDGTCNGKKLESAVYDYVLEATLFSGTKVTKSGNISLVK